MQAEAINSGGVGFCTVRYSTGMILFYSFIAALHRRDFCFSPLSVPVAGGKTLTLVTGKGFSIIRHRINMAILF